MLFPAHAGVFPEGAVEYHEGDALPRARGGISVIKGIIQVVTSSSPRTRGYFRHRCLRVAFETLFPAHAGVFPVSGHEYTRIDPLPRARGGISTSPPITRLGYFSSPRTRGYFRSADTSTQKTTLFPAHAGVFPNIGKSGLYKYALPRARGGISVSHAVFLENLPSSPRTRGYFHRVPRKGRAHLLFPAHAGVFPSVNYLTLLCGCSSPRTRGYFHQADPGTSSQSLFPAHAGVFPNPSSTQTRSSTLPRARGGISTTTLDALKFDGSSPRTRGYFRSY